MNRHATTVYRAFFLFSILVVLVFFGEKAGAQEIIYVGAGESLQSALDEVGSISGAVEIRIAQGVYSGPFIYDNTKIRVSEQSLTITGGWSGGFDGRQNPGDVNADSMKTILRGTSGGGTVLFIQDWNDYDSINVEINGVQIEGGSSSLDSDSAAGLMIDLNNTGSVTLRNSIITNNEYRGTDGVGGAGISSHGSVTIEDNTITGNTSPYFGGGIAIGGDCRVTMNRNTIENNNSEGGGGGVRIHTNVASVTMTDNTIRNNTGGYGAGLLIHRDENRDGLTAIILERNTVTGNNGSGRGGGITCFNTSGEINQNVLRNNDAEYGAGLSIDESAVAIAGNVLESNTSEFGGGGLYISESSGTVSGNTFSSNRAGSMADGVGDGGGIHVTDCVNSGLTITGNTISQNLAGYDGGGILFKNSDSVIEKNYIENNICGNWGGGICDQSSSGRIRNNIVADNYAGEHGGGLSFFNGSGTISANNTIFGNTAYHSGGGVFSDQNGETVAATVSNTILWNNAPQQLETEENGEINVNNCIVDQAAYAGSNGNVRRDPALVEVSQGKYHLGQNSPKDGGSSNNAPSDDIDGESRPSSGIDIGADEFNPNAQSVDQSPTAVINVSQNTVGDNIEITLDGTDSSDPENSTLSYNWSQIRGTSVNLSDSDSATVTFTVRSSETETLRFTLTVTDANGKTGKRTVFVKPDEEMPEPDQPEPDDPDVDDPDVDDPDTDDPDTDDPDADDPDTDDPDADDPDADDPDVDDPDVDDPEPDDLEQMERYIHGGIEPSDLQMISLPYELENPDPEYLFRDIRYEIDENFRIGSYSAGENRNMHFGEMEDIKPGKSFWFLARDGYDITFSGEPVDEESDHEVPLEYKGHNGPGWYMIACPYDAEYDWRNVLVIHDSIADPVKIEDQDPANMIVERCLWGWQGEYVQTNLMESGKGYFIKTLRENCTLKFLSDETDQTRSRNVAKTASTNCSSPPESVGGLKNRAVKDGRGGCFIESFVR